MSGRLAEAEAAWRERKGQDLPEWVRALVGACVESSQSKVAKRLGVSGAQVSQVILAKYPSDLTGIEDRVRSVLMSGTVDCPVLKEITSADCLKWRDEGRKLTRANPIYRRMYRACAACPLNPAVARAAEADTQDKENAA